MKKILRITGILINITATASWPSTFENLFEKSKKTDDCGFLKGYSDDLLKEVKRQGMAKVAQSSDTEEIKQVVSFVNRISDCRFPMARKYNPQHFINQLK